MKEISLGSFVDEIHHEKAIVFFHKHGCSRCSTTKPLLERLEKENPDIKVMSYFCSEIDDITKNLPIKVFPGIFCYRNGQRIAGNENLYPLDFYISAFNSVEQKKVGVYDCSQLAGTLESQLKEAQARAEFLNDSIVLETQTGEQFLPATEDFLPPAQTISEGEKVPCEECQ